MGPREEDNGVLLLGAVAAICAMIAFVPDLLGPAPAIAQKAVGITRVDAAKPARVILPFAPNTTPSAH